MSHSNDRLPSIDRLKQRAKKLKKEKNLTHSEALGVISREYGFSSWHELQRSYNKADEQSGRYSVAVASNQSSILADQETVRKISENKKFLTQQGVEFSVFTITATQLARKIHKKRRILFNPLI